MDADGLTSCHRGQPTRWNPAERTCQRPVHRGTVASAWLTSGLLRRVGLIRTLGTPLAVTGWMGHHERDGGERWIIDPMFAEGHGVTGHRRLTALLSAPGWGLSLTAVDEHCNCDLPSGFSDQCTTVLAGQGDRSGVLEVRAIQRRGDRLEWIQNRHPALFAAQQELVRSVPAWIDHWLARGAYSASGVPAGAAGKPRPAG
ncbi:MULTISPECIES: hypothetical protein [Streptomyces]|uniref:Uncharacterized protein n=1 Tax=Streptomyces ramulosus TaxID=47762 RepID=A0ABW1FC85_9ACTN